MAHGNVRFAQGGWRKVKHILPNGDLMVIYHGRK